MPKSSAAVEKMIAQLGALRKNPNAPDAKEQIIAALASKISYIVERAATLAGELKLDVAPQMEAAFNRLLTGDDKTCGGKTAIAKSLYELGADTPGVFLAGIKHVQMEASFGPPVDVAALLRGICALGLVRIAHREAMLHITDLLADPEAQARVLAARALAYSGRDDAAFVLRLKIHVGDKDPEVIGECLTAIMKLAPKTSIDLVADQLDDPDELIRESAALALGESRRREAFEALRNHIEHQPDPEMRRPLVLAIAVSRLPEAFSYLVTLIESADANTVLHVLEALKIYRTDESLRKSVAAAVAKRSEPAIRRAHHGAFEPGS
ncbi:MAG TPA: HEAT repeat domain-containing protein [Humisphaera sp.]|jgi:HEAT repeat protein|nr:HEAT repeat domain-containing protein [Humisphaera sp.]